VGICHAGRGLQGGSTGDPVILSDVLFQDDFLICNSPNEQIV